MSKKLTIEDCLEAVSKINEGSSITEDLLLDKARWLYILNKLNFWQDLPVLMDIIKSEIKKSTNQPKDVFIVQSSGGLIHGCFYTKEQALKYISDSSTMNIVKLDIV